MDPEQFCRDAESFHQELNLEYYRASAGLKAELELEPIYSRYPQLFEGERFQEISTWDLEPKQARYVRCFIADGYLEREARELTERFAAGEAAATVDWEERPVPYRQMPLLIANEKDPVLRHAMESGYLAAMATLNPPLEGREKRNQRGARSFGYDDYVALYDDLHGLKLVELTRNMQGFLAESQDLYFSALDTYLHEMRILREDARRCDAARIFRAAEYDAAFPAERLMPTLHGALRDLGFLLEDQTNIRLDSEPRPLKSPRAFCSVVHVPNDVRLVVKPAGGQQDYETLFHEAGHAEHYANVDRSQPFAYRYLGDAAVTESYAFLLEYLTYDAHWLRRHLQYEPSAGYRHLVGFHKLYMLRRYATKLVYEQVLHRADEPGDVASYYDQLMAENLGLGYGPEGFLTDVDDGFYCAQYLRAWIFEAQHRRYLLREFGDEWFRNPKASKFLVELWREGQKYSVDELAGFMGYEGLDLGPVAEDVRDLMGAR